MEPTFGRPSWVPALPFDPPDSIALADFVLNEEVYGRHPLADSKAPFTCGLSGRTYSAEEVKRRVDHLARALAARLGWQPNEGSEWDKVIGTLSLNSVDYMPVAWAIHRLSGISAPINAAYSTAEVEHQLKATSCKALFTCAPLLDKALEAAKKADIPEEHVFLIELPKQAMRGAIIAARFKTVDDLILEGAKLQPLEPLRWKKGQGASQTAFLCASSGTSGLPKMVMVSHRNIIANVLQMTTFEKPHRQTGREVSLGLLPQSHSFSLVMVCHVSIYRGDGVVIMPNFDLQQLFQAVQDYRMTRLYVVPAMVVAMAKGAALMNQFDLSCVTSLAIGAAPLSTDTAALIATLQPHWKILQGYGLTETSVVVASTSLADIELGSCGHLLPGYEAKLIDAEGRTIAEENQPGELVLRSPSIVLGYLDNEKADEELFMSDGWMRTGDVAVVRKSAQGFEHVFIVDRLKELIKVKGNQVAPAELEAFLCLHSAVEEAAVMPVPDYTAGELPMAYIVRSAAAKSQIEKDLKVELQEYVKTNMAPWKQLKGGIEFLDILPRGSSGKVMRKDLKEMAKKRSIPEPVAISDVVLHGTPVERMSSVEVFLDTNKRSAVAHVITFADDDDDD